MKKKTKKVDEEGKVPKINKKSEVCDRCEVIIVTIKYIGYSIERGS